MRLTHFSSSCWKDDMRKICASHLVIEMKGEKYICVTVLNGTEFAYICLVCVLEFKKGFFKLLQVSRKKARLTLGFFLSKNLNYVFKVTYKKFAMKRMLIPESVS